MAQFRRIISKNKGLIPFFVKIQFFHKFHIENKIDLELIALELRLFLFLIKFYKINTSHNLASSYRDYLGP